MPDSLLYDKIFNQNRILQSANEGVGSRDAGSAARINNTDAAHGSAAAFGAGVTPMTGISKASADMNISFNVT